MADADRTGLRGDQPIRTCIGCRTPDSRSVLLRVVAGTGPEGIVSLVPDIRRRLPGRGCWLHPVRDCLDIAIRRRAFGRALRVDGPVDPGAIVAYVEALLAEGDPDRRALRDPKAGFPR